MQGEFNVRNPQSKLSNIKSVTETVPTFESEDLEIFLDAEIEVKVDNKK
ncbi:hypothetical protein M0R72_06635 [Candidatus Pacearchaeota archaeon]|nr:hypothetical protein [Candidatus Pacearchaeota archaeon]